MCVCVPGVCVWEPGELVKTFTAWKILASLENTGKPGKYWERYWGMFFAENNGIDPDGNI